MPQKDAYKKRYDITKTFEYNKKNGPFAPIRDQNKKIDALLKNHFIKADFFGYKTKLPIGVAAGPLYNPRYMIGAARDGFNVITWKTFRSEHRLAHRNDGAYVGHNIVFVPPQTITQKEVGAQRPGTLKTTLTPGDISITNSFGMPSPTPAEWLPDITPMEEYMDTHDKCAITSVVGSPRPDGTIQDLALDYAFVARAAESAGARIIEINLSCPNVSGKEGVIYKNVRDAALIAKTVREHFACRETKLLIKIGYGTKSSYRTLLKRCAPFVNGIVAINTIPMEIVDHKGKQALPGGLSSGTCGRAILDLSVRAVKNLAELKKEMKLTQIKIIGCGGVTNPQGALAHIDAGAEFVMVATAALFNPQLPLDLARHIHDNKIKRTI